MHGPAFTWDARKAAANRRKHGVAFEEARSAFYDEHARLIADPDHSQNEERYILLGLSALTNVLVVAHCYQESADTIRIISARRATKREERQYRGQLP
jgi:hypothetical protein